MTVLSEFAYDYENLHEVMKTIFYEEVFLDVFESNKEVLIQFLMTSLNMLGEPYEAEIYRSNPADGPIKYIATFPHTNFVFEFPLAAFHQMFYELEKTIAKAPN